MSLIQVQMQRVNVGVKIIDNKYLELGLGVNNPDSYIFSFDEWRSHRTRRRFDKWC